MSLEQTIGNLEIRYANVVTFVGSSNTMVDTTTGRIQTKGFQHNSNVITDVSGPHGRLPTTQPIVEHPIMHIDQTAERPKLWTANDNSSNISVKAGYTVTASTVYNSNLGHFDVSRLYDGHPDGNDGIYYCSGGTAGNGTSYSSTSGLYRDTTTSGGYSAYGGTAITTTVSGVSKEGEWLGIETPHPIVLKHIILFANGTAVYSHGTPHKGVFAGSHDGVTWDSISTFNDFMAGTSTRNVTANPLGPHRLDVNSTTAYKYHRMIVEAIQSTYGNANGGAYLIVDELKWYGCNDNPPAGDHSVDTTFKSRFNNPQLTGVQVLVDGATGVGTNQISGGADPSGNQVTMTSPNKYWTLNGTLTSNLSVEANTFLEGDQPHAVSVWFNSSNLEANVSNTCVFSIASEEKLDSVNLDLQSNTWHNLTYAYQGEGGSRVTYLDGRKVAEDQAEDTFGIYPPFDMTGYAQGGYVASASSEYIPTPQYRAWEAFNDITASDYDNWTSGDFYAANGGDGTRSTITWSGSTNHNGEYVKLYLPHKLIVNYVKFEGRQGSGVERQLPRAFTIIGSNDDVNWETIHQETRTTNPSTDETHAMTGVSKHMGFKYIALVPRNSGSTNTNTHISIGNISYYGHRENDLVRLPDPTNVLKYPHIAMTGYAQRGYAVTPSVAVNGATTGDNLGQNRRAWMAFNGITDGSPNTFWQMGDNSHYATSGDAVASHAPIVPGHTTRGGWLKLELPHKLLLNKVIVHSQNAKTLATGSEGVNSAKIYGSNNDTSWDVIKDTYVLNYVDTSVSVAEDTISTSTAYKYIIFQITKTGGGPGATVRELQFYGTGVDSIPIQIGGGNIDRVANFRVYDKFIGEDQVNEIWNAQKEEFGRAKPQMVLQQGKLGIGTDAPQGSLSVADEPDPTTYAIQEFPPKPLTGYSTHIEGHGDFRIHYSGNHSSGPILNAFNKKAPVGDFWYSVTNSYEGANNLYSLSAVSPIGIEGEWMYMTLPYHVDMKSLQITARNGEVNSAPKTAVIFGSADWGVTWEQVGNWSDKTSANHWLDGGMPSPAFTINSNKSLNSIGFVVTHGQGSYAFTLGEIKFFGYREQVTKQSVLHDGQLTLTKSLNVPRIGPDLDADDTPRRDRLVVEYNTSADPTFEGAVRDTSGRGNDGVFYGGASYDATQKALVFDGTASDQFVHTLKNGRSESGNIDYSVSLWFNPTTVNVARWRAIFAIGVLDRTQPTDNNGDEITLFVNNGTNALHLQNGGSSVNTGALNAGQWVHIVVTYDGTNRKIYLDGSLSVSNGYTSINLPKEMLIRLAQSIPNNGEQDEYMDCKISNFKAWFGAALTAQEVETLYDMGRLGNGLYPLHIDAPVHINGPLYAPGTILNITQFVDEVGRQVANNNSTIQTGYTTPPVHMKAGSKVKLDFHIPWRQDGSSGWRGGYHWIYFRLNKTVAGVAANTWVFLLASGYSMDNGSSVISDYTNSCYLPLSVPEDFTIEFQHRWRPYENTSSIMYINSAHHINITTDANLLKLGFPYNNLGWSKYIITEISK